MQSKKWGKTPYSVRFSTIVALTVFFTGVSGCSGGAEFARPVQYFQQNGGYTTMYRINETNRGAAAPYEAVPAAGFVPVERRAGGRPVYGEGEAADFVRVAGITDEIRALVESGSPSNLHKALELTRQNGVAGTEFGRVMSSVALILLEKVYGEVPPASLKADLPQAHKYAKIIRGAEGGRYTQPPITSNDYLELTLPFLALLGETQIAKLSPAMPDLEKARRIKADGCLAVYFLGLLFERMPRYDGAAERYIEALNIAPDCYIAALGLARVLSAEGRQAEALDLITQLEQRYPNNAGVKRQLAFVYAQEKLFDKAGDAIQQALAANSRDPAMLILYARYLIEKGQAIQAQFPLDTYIQDNRETLEYLFLRVRIAAEGFNNKNNALSQLRQLLRGASGNMEIRIYTIRLLLESTAESDNREGQAMLAALLKAQTDSGGAIPYELIDLALKDAVRRGAWDEAKQYRDLIPEERRGSSDLLNSYEIEHGMGNKREALSYARKLREKYPDNEEGSIAYAGALIEVGQKDEAARIINERINRIGAGSFKSRYYYLRSRLQSGGDAVQADLRSALFENPRNLDAILAMFEISDKKNDERRAIYYLKQAIALAPNNPAVKNYERKYAGKL
ncbi:MAG: hypothetical protein LBD20_06985 [Spirochaetaceae bacterium]|nr:hypothetical protein [Spirochaetaceae bacterium]